MSEDITVVVPVYGPGPHLEKVVAALKEQSPPVRKIIVSHSGEGDPTPRFSGDSLVTVLHTDGRLFAGAARNRGLTLAESEWVAFIDEDVIADEGWHRALQDAMQARDADCILGSVGWATTGGYWGMSLWFAEFGPVHPYLSRRPISGGASANMAVRRETFEAIGGFPENWRMGEDALAHARLAAAGGRVVFDPAIMVRHVNIGGVRRMLRHLFHMGRYSAQVRRHHPELPGGWAVRLPLISLVLWPARIAQVSLRVLRASNAPWASFFLHSPGVLFGLAAWNAGFASEAFRLRLRPSDY